MMRKYFIMGILMCIFGLASGGRATAQTEGLLGEYYGTVNMTELRATRIDSQVFFDWQNGSPLSGLGMDYFSICWTGFVTPVESGIYTFYITSDDGVRLWLDETMVVNQWKGQSPTEYSASLTLEAGQPCPIRIDYYENTGGAVIKLEWEGPGQTRSAIAAEYLTPGAGIGDRLLYWHRNPHNLHYYKMIGPMTWAAGKAQAEAMGGYLTTINDAAEGQWLAELFRPVSDAAFIGANDIAEEGTWVWDQTGETFWNGLADGTPVPGFYTNWNSGEPNDSSDEDVATIYLTSGLWNDLNVARERYCIVESDIGQLNYDGPSPARTTLQLEDAYEVTVTPRQPVGTVQYQWYKDDTPIPGGTLAKLIVFQVSYEDAGLYTCQITDETPATVRTRAAELIVVKKLPALSVTGLACLATLLAVTAAMRKRA